MPCNGFFAFGILCTHRFCWAVCTQIRAAFVFAVAITVRGRIMQCLVFRADHIVKVFIVNICIPDVLDSITDQAVQKLNIETFPLINVTDDRKLREFLFNYFYQVSIYHEDISMVNYVNNFAIPRYLETKMPQNFMPNTSSESDMSQKYGWVGKLCVLDGIARQWVATGLREAPEEMIDYVMPVIKQL